MIVVRVTDAELIIKGKYFVETNNNNNNKTSLVLTRQKIVFLGKIPELFYRSVHERFPEDLM